MKKFKITKEQLMNLNEETNIVTSEKLTKWFPQAFESELEVGKWYKSTDNNGFMFYIKEFKENNYIGYGKLEPSGEFHNEWWFTKNSVYGQSLVLSNKEEVETALIAEAKRRGFKEGVKFNNACNGTVHKKNSGTVNNKISYMVDSDSDIDGLHSNNQWIFFNGKWAEIISEPIELTLEQIAEKFNVNVEQLKIKK